MRYFDFLELLSRCTSISGTEAKDHGMLKEALSPYFDRVETDRLGNLIGYLDAKDPKAPLLMIDAHFDQIGLMVTDQKEGGFLTFTTVGGVDTRILPATDVTIHGKKELFGVISSTPPHLRNPEDADKLTPAEGLLIDCGIMDKETLADLAPVGTPVSFRLPLAKLQKGRLTGAGLDNKACGAAALLFASTVKKEELLCNVAVVLSSFEEIGGKGAVTGAYALNPDIAVVLDVNFAKAPGVGGAESIKMGDGPSVSLSVLTHRKLSKRVIALGKEKEIPVQTIVEVGNLGTNGNNIPLQRCAIATVNMSMPLSSMHSPAEIVCEEDGEALSRLLCEMACDKEFCLGEVCL